jgi:CRISPR/Cas system CMR subunit Cmr6 (Cas7 group RAMP superfamily)
MSFDPGAYQYMNSLKVNAKSQKKKEKNENKIIDNMYTVCRKYNKALDEITKKELTKQEYKQLLDFLQLRNYSLQMYPNLQ